jgi:O-antigen/teichoic acid export membrane protein
VVRRALAMATGEQYCRLGVQFVVIVVVSRLLTPAEIGISVIGIGIMTIALGMREFATSDFLIQRPKVSEDEIRASFTVVCLLTILITVATFVLAPWFGAFYGEEQLGWFLRVAAVAGLIEALSLHIRGLLRRDMAFGALALINTAAAAAGAAATILLALAGFSFMSFAWALLASAVATTILSFYFRPNVAIVRPTLRCCRDVLTFGGYNGASFVINRTYEMLPQLVLGRFLPHSAVGVYDRASVLSDIPDKTILMSVFSVAFPALAAETREGRDLKGPYLRALGYITVLYWPAQVLLILLVYPIVSLLLGQQWLGVVPVLQLLAVATFAWFPVMLTSPVLLAVGANRDRVMADLIGRSVSALVLCSAAWFGIMAMAASKLVTLPFQMVLSFRFVRRHVPFSGHELAAALWKSAVVTASSAAGPLCVIALSDWSFDLSVTATAAALLFAATGWMIGVLVTRHPVMLELVRIVEDLAQTPFVRRLRGRADSHASSAGSGLATSGVAGRR